MGMSSIVIISLIAGIIAGAAVNEQLIIPTMIVTFALLFIISLPAWKNKQNKPAKPPQTQWKNFPETIGFHSTDEYFAWPELNEFEFEVVGESYYQPALAKLASEYPDSDSLSKAAKPLTAHLILDDFNEYDDKAVRVEINGLQIGHLSREDARSFRRRLSAKKLTGQTTTCGALITGGHVVNGKQMHHGAVLDLKPFE